MVKLNRIYTRTGDDGTTGLVDGSRIAKTAPRMAAIGDVDELNSALGIAIVALADEANQIELSANLRMIQNDLFDLGADLATPGEDFEPGEMTLRVTPGQVARLESEIDAMNADLAPLDSFILPGGRPAAAAVHLARAVCRRAERSTVAASRETPINPAATQYLNRLSDYLFVAARSINAPHGGDPKWIPGASR